MLGQTMTNRRDKSVKNDRKSMWDNSAMRRVTQAQTSQTSVITANKKIFRVCIYLILM